MDLTKLKIIEHFFKLIGLVFFQRSIQPQAIRGYRPRYKASQVDTGLPGRYRLARYIQGCQAEKGLPDRHSIHSQEVTDLSGRHSIAR